MTDYRQEQLDKLKALDVDAERDRLKAENPDVDSIYPHLCGCLQFYVGEAIKLAESLKKELDDKARRLHSMEWAAETVLNETEVSTYDRSEVYELLYAATDVVEKAIKGGMTDDELRKRLADGIKDDEIEAGRLISDEDRCGDCGDVCEDEICETCQDIRDEDAANSPAA